MNLSKARVFLSIFLSICLTSGLFGQPTKMLLLGDSIMRGEGAGQPTPLDGFRDDLYTDLVNEGVSFDFVGGLSDGNFPDTEHEGHSGFQSNQIDANIDSFLTANPPDMVLLHIGTNDISSSVAVGNISANIESIVDKILLFNTNIKILVSGIIPRKDSKNVNVEPLNELIRVIVQRKIDAGNEVFYVSQYEVFTQTASWETALMADVLHPNDIGYGLMADTYLAAITTALNGSATQVTDNFSRLQIGPTWVVDPGFSIVNNELANGASDGQWGHMAVYNQEVNSDRVSFTWGANATADGIANGGFALRLDKPGIDASGYLVWRNGPNLDLWTIVNGVPDQGLGITAANLPVPQAGDEFKVILRSNSNGHFFDVYINDVFDGTLNDSQRLQGNSSTLYAGLMLRGTGNNDIDNYHSVTVADPIPPAAIDDLTALSPSPSSITLEWGAPGNDGDVGTATSYIIKYSTLPLNESNFDMGLAVTNAPVPLPATTIQSVIVGNLLHGTQYYFAIKSEDDAGNVSGISNIATDVTTFGVSLVDDFNRVSLGSDWSAHPSFAIQNNELTNLSAVADFVLATYNKGNNSVTAQFKWGVGADVSGIGAGGFALMLDASSSTASGYFLFMRPGPQKVDLWSIESGVPIQSIATIDGLLTGPLAGDVVKIQLSSNATGHHFDVAINGEFHGRISDPNKVQGNAQQLYAGVMLGGAGNNNVDDFTIVAKIGDPANLVVQHGQGQVGTSGTQLSDSLVVKVEDSSGNPVPQQIVDFNVIEGGGSLISPQSGPNIIIEAEAGSLTSPMQIGSDVGASGGRFIHVPLGTGSGGPGQAVFNFNIPETGDYLIWGRVIGPDGTHDSFFASVDGGADFIWVVPKATEWVWDLVSERLGADPVVFANLSAGMHTFTLKNREDGTQLDKIIITNDSAFTPTGVGNVDGPITDANGEVYVYLTLGNTAGQNRVQATVAGLAPKEFSATGVADSAETITLISGNNQNQTVLPGAPLPNPFVVELIDQYGNLVTNFATNWIVIAGNGTVATPTVLTDDFGRAQNTFTLATDGSVNQVQVSSPGYTGPDAIFTATPSAGAGVNLSLFSGDNQTGTASKLLDQPLKVIVTDIVGTRVPNVNVTFAVTGGGGTFDGISPVTVKSDSNGVAAATLTLGPTPGTTNEVQASSSFDGTPLNGSPVNFTATSAVPQSLDPISNLTQAGTASIPLADSIAVRVLDANSNALPGYPVTFEIITQGGFEAGRVNGSTSSVTVPTNDSGVAKVEWSLGPGDGSNNNKLRAFSTYNSQALSGSPIEFTASAAVGSAATIVEIFGNGQINQIETELDDPFIVEVQDLGGNPLVGWPVIFTVISGGGALSNGQTSQMVNTDDEGRAKTTLTLGSEAGTPVIPFNNIVEAAAENNGQPLTNAPIVFRASAKATGADSILAVSSTTLAGQAGKKLSPVQVKITDKNGNPIGAHKVVFTITNGGGSLNGTTETQVVAFTDQTTGIASVDWHLGGLLDPQLQTLQATSTDGIKDLKGSPVIFSAIVSAGDVDPDASTVIATPTAVQANGVDKSIITVTLKDIFGNPIQGKAINIISSGSINVIEQSSGPTNGNGQVFGSIASIVAEVKQITARNVTDGIDLNTFAEVTFLNGVPDDVELLGGNNQIANIGTALPNLIEILVTDNLNNPVPGITVEFEVTAGGGFIAATSAPVQGSATLEQPESTTTNANGIAGATWVLGPNTGENKAVASAFFNGNLIDSSIKFTATGIQATASFMIMAGGNEQADIPAGTKAPEPISVKISDSNGKPVAGVAVNFSMEVGGGSVVTSSAVSDPQGLASTSVNLGVVVGQNVFNATNASLAGSPISFTITSVIGGPSKIERVSGNGVDAAVGSIHVVSAIVADLYGNALQGQSVTFKIVSGGGNIPNENQVTDSQGIATTQVIMPNTIGDVVINATAAALPTHFVLYRVTAVHGTPTTLLEMSGNNQDGSPDKPLVDDLVVKVTDVFGNPVSDFQIQWVALGGGSFPSSITATNAAGLASNNMTLGTAIGKYTGLAIASTSILSPSQLSFEANVVDNNFPEITGLSDQEVTEGQLLQFTINAIDSDNDPLSFRVENRPAGASFNPGTGTFSWTPGQTQSNGSPYAVTFIVEDNRGGLDAETINITVLNANNPPRIVSFSPQTLEMPFIKGADLPFEVTVEDLDGDPLAYTWLLFEGPGDDSGELVSTSSSYNMNTSTREHATFIVQIRVTDGQDADTLKWYLDLITSVDLSSFSGNFEGFDGVRISWSTSREIDNDGFNILRSSSENGTYEKVTSKLIPSSGKGEYSFVDNSVKAGGTYYYKLEDVNINGVKTEHGPILIKITAPEKFELSQNYPNPFNPETKIRYQLPTASAVQIKIFDVLGREVKTLVNQDVEAGFHIVTWNALNKNGVRVSSGVYYYYIRAGEYKITKKMLLMK